MFIFSAVPPNDAYVRSQGADENRFSFWQHTYVCGICSYACACVCGKKIPPCVSEMHLKNMKFIYSESTVEQHVFVPIKTKDTDANKINTPHMQIWNTHIREIPYNTQQMSMPSPHVPSSRCGLALSQFHLQHHPVLYSTHYTVTLQVFIFKCYRMPSRMRQRRVRRASHTGRRYSDEPTQGERELSACHLLCLCQTGMDQPTLKGQTGLSITGLNEAI